MKTIRLNIDLGKLKAGDTTQMDDRIAKHFIAKGWGVEVELPEEVEPEVEPAKENPVKKERKVIGKIKRK